MNHASIAIAEALQSFYPFSEFAGGVALFAGILLGIILSQAGSCIATRKAAVRVSRHESVPFYRAWTSIRIRRA